MNKLSPSPQLPKDHPFHDRKVFTVAQANAALPLVRAIATDLANLSREVSERRERLALLRMGRDRSSKDPYSQELTQVEEDLEKDTQQLLEYVEELRAFGVDPKNGPEGLLDFPSIIDGRGVFLCWKLGEASVSHWHELEAGFQGRQPIVNGECVCSSRAGSAPNAD